MPHKSYLVAQVKILSECYSCPFTLLFLKQTLADCDNLVLYGSYYYREKFCKRWKIMKNSVMLMFSGIFSRLPSN